MSELPVSELPVTGSAQTLHALLDDAAAAAPTAPAISDAGGGWSYAELAGLSHAFADWLAGRGIAAGDRVLVQSPNRRELAAALFGCSRRGAVFVPINPAMKPFHLRPVLADCEPRVALVGDGTAGAVRELTGTEVVELSAVWPAIEALPRGRAASSPDVAAGDIAVLIYTSGSTAAPKAVVCPHRPMVFAARAISAVLGYQQDDIVYCRLPLAFDYGLYQILLACLARAQLVVAGTGSEIRVLAEIRRAGATVVPVVPSLATMLTALASRDPGPTGVRLFTNTGAALPQATVEALRSRFAGARVTRMFGTTECKRITIMPPEADRERPASVGLPLPGTEVAIVDDEGHRLPPGRTGEIVVTGPHVMAGYWRAPGPTARTFRHDPSTGQTRLHTGDYGYLDDDGYLYFEGRRDDMFKHRGARVSTIEIEAAAADIPGVRGAVAIPPSADGDELRICVATDLAPHLVLRGLAARLEPAKVPVACHVVAEIPLTPNGKSDRQAVALLLRREVSGAVR